MPKTMTQLYTTLVLVLIRRHMIEKGEWDEECGMPDNFNDLPPEIMSDFEKVCELACTSLLQEDIQLVFTDSEVGKGFPHLGLLVETKELHMCAGARISFLPPPEHTGLPAAWHVSRHRQLVSMASTWVFVEGSANRPNTFGLFLSGLIGCGHIQKKVFDEVYAITCLYEAQDPTDMSLLNKLHQ